MSGMTIFSGSYCNADTIVKTIVDKTGYNMLTDQDIIARASLISGISEKKISRAVSDKASVFNNFTHEKERSVAFIKLALAQSLPETDFIINGFTGLLVPNAIHHVLRLCMIADTAQRVETVVQRRGVDKKEALSILHEEDEACSAWVNSLFKTRDPWDPSLYDIVIPTDKMSVDDIAELVHINLKNEVIQPTKASLKATEDFVLAAHVEVALAKEGHAVDVSARDGFVTLTIHKNVLMLGRLEGELKNIVGNVEGVKTVETRIGKGFYQEDVYRRYDFEVPSKVLLVDDEREFV